MYHVLFTFAGERFYRSNFSSFADALDFAWCVRRGSLVRVLGEPVVDLWRAFSGQPFGDGRGGV